MKCIIVVPVYRKLADKYERQSFSSSCRLCQCEDDADLCIVTHSGVDLSEFIQIAAQNTVHLDIKLFHSAYFNGLHGYNKLMLNREFYRTFSEYDFILISQLDAMIFRHNLKEWCEMDYDYIGAPLFAPGFYTTAEYATIGNGGLSLRKTATFISILKKDARFSIRELLSIKRPYHPKYTFNKRTLYLLMLWSLGRSQKLLFFLSHWVAEDLFFSFSLQGTSLQLNVPTAEKGALFSYDLNHKFWYGHTDGIVPFGVHRWNDANSMFWSPILKQEGYAVNSLYISMEQPWN